MRLSGEEKMHLVLLASVTFPSVGELCHFVRPPAMSENDRFFGGAGRGSYRQIRDAQMHPSSNGKMRQREGMASRRVYVRLSARCFLLAVRQDGGLRKGGNHAAL